MYSECLCRWKLWNLVSVCVCQDYSHAITLSFNFPSLSALARKSSTPTQTWPIIMSHPLLQLQDTFISTWSRQIAHFPVPKSPSKVLIVIIEVSVFQEEDSRASMDEWWSQWPTQFSMAQWMETYSSLPLPLTSTLLLADPVRRVVVCVNVCGDTKCSLHTRTLVQRCNWSVDEWQA